MVRQTPDNEQLWRPSASLELLERRAEILASIRSFFAERRILEVETPLLSRGGTTELHLESLRTRLEAPALDAPLELYLQTSPELLMKRLLAAGTGSIYQLGKAFRGGEAGRRHNPEFTLLEWYRPGFDHHQLMDEVAELVKRLVGSRTELRMSYTEAFDRALGLDPIEAPTEELLEKARPFDAVGLDADDRDGLLSLLLARAVEPSFDPACATFLYDFPASQASLARVRDGSVAERFELFLGGLELANGFCELTDASEQRRRFEHDLEERRRRGLAVVPIDERFLAALEHGLPSCAGVALGVDRLVMVATGATTIQEVLAFPLDRA